MVRQEKKKARKKPPVLEPVGAPVAQAVPAVQPGIEAVQPFGEIPAVQQPVVEIAPVGVVADTNVVVSTEAPTAPPQPTGWSKRSQSPIEDIHKKLDRMMDAKGKSLEERYADRFGDNLPDSVAADSARKEYNEKKRAESDKPKITFKHTSQLKLTPKERNAPPDEKKTLAKSETDTDKESGIGSRIGSGIKSGGTKTKAAFGRAGSAVGRGAGAVKSGIGRGASKIAGLFRGKGKNENRNQKRGRVAKKKQIIVQ
uniref:Uncharacterized protein n=1 Tax=uncultured marine group II/III euryarchaeote AD1000_39_C04 TaxID=1457762 RepID=A0A075FPJ1_9EURY|nr:hypothetical protein [uncultured marine group II/III euryarchaeote AD1000_39_C04]